MKNLFSNFRKQPEKTPSLPEARTDIPKMPSDIRLENNVNRLWEAHDRFTNTLRDFLADLEKNNKR